MVKKRSGFNIRNKVLLILCAVLALTIVGNFVISAELFENAQVAAFDKEAFATARGLQTNINSLIDKSFLSYTDIVNCEPLLDHFVANNEHVLYTYTTDEKGLVLYASEGVVKDGIGSEKLETIILSGAEERIEDREKETLYYILPLQDTDEVDGNPVISQVGVLVVAYPRSCITEPLNKLYAYNAILASITFTFSLMLTFLLITKWVTKPLQMLDVAIRKVSKKGFEETSLEIETNDEIGQIAQSFNDMLEQLAVTTVSQDYVNSILLNMSEALFVIDRDKRIESVNDAATNLLGYTREEIQGQQVDFLYANAEDNPFNKNDFVDTIDEDISRNNETEFVDKNENIIAVSVNWSTIKDDAGSISKYVCTARDITEIKKAQSIVMHQANYDELTGLFNRYKLEQSIEKILGDVDAQHVFIVIDLDKFKIVNDICGHAAGDQLLKQIAYMIKCAAGDSNLTARLGGDEFAIILYDTNIQEAAKNMENLLKDIRNFNFAWEGKVFNVGMSIGAFEINRSGLSRLSVFTAADRACYIAKQKGGNRVHIYTEEDKELSDREEEASMMPVVTEAFENNRFFLVYQPIVSLDHKDEICSFEVLLRLKTKDGVVLEPQAFMASAERYNMSLLLDQWVIHNFCENYQKEIALLCGGREVQFNINLTSESLNAEHFFDFIQEEFSKYNIEPGIMCFEVAENYAISNFLDATALMKKLRDMGCKFAINSFGIGTSSFMHLRLWPVDTIKIDGGFIKEIVRSPMDMAVVKAINEIAHLLNIKTVAACVENEEVLERVKELGIDYAQGYELMKPGKFEEVFNISAI